MKDKLLLTVILSLGFSLAWLSKSLWIPENSLPISMANHPEIWQPTDTDTTTQYALNKSSPEVLTSSLPASPINDDSEPKRVLIEAPAVRLTKMLESHRYQDAMIFYQDQDRLGEQPITTFKERLLMYLNQLLAGQNHEDFSELANLFLAFYYDDVDVLLLMADLNFTEGDLIEASNVYQLANTYAYTDASQKKLLEEFDEFVVEVDYFYTLQEDWFALSNFYSHIEASGLFSPQNQYRQAIVMLNSGKSLVAIKLLQQLVNDKLVGEKAKTVLEKLIAKDSM